jgi:hypothetical protein
MQRIAIRAAIPGSLSVLGFTSAWPQEVHIIALGLALDVPQLVQNLVALAGSLPHLTQALASGAFIFVPHSPQKFAVMTIGTPAMLNNLLENQWKKPKMKKKIIQESIISLPASRRSHQ